MYKELSGKLLVNYLYNYSVLKLDKTRLLRPLFFTHYLTLKCNFHCAYCGFAENLKKYKNSDELNTADTIKLMSVINKECPNIYFTGGEPLLRHDIAKILEACKYMGFKSISINTNMSLIHKKMDILNYVTNLVASFDVLDANEYVHILGVPLRIVHQVKENIIECSRLQKEKDFLMTVNCVVTDQTIPQAREVMEFCFSHNIRFAIVPAELEAGMINPNLKNNGEYKSLIKDVIKAKKDGKPVFGSYKYLETICYFKPFTCYPTLTPHTYPNGDLFYPCEPLQMVAANLLKTPSYNEALNRGIKKFGSLPPCKDKCFKACYVESAHTSKFLSSLYKEYFK